MKILLQKRLGIGLVGFLFLLIWIQFSKYWCYSLIVPLMFLILITRNSYTYAKAKKLCLGKCYFDEKSIIYYFWTRKVYIFFVALFVGSVLTLSLVLASTQFTFIDIGVLALDTFLLVILYSFLEKNNTFNKKIKIPIIKNITAWINSIFIVVIYFILTYYQTPPDYLQVDLNSTLQIIQKKTYSQCETIDFLAYITSSIIAIKWWLLTKATFIFENIYLKKILWILHLLGNYMMIFAYSRFLLELLDIFMLQEKIKDIDNES